MRILRVVLIGLICFFVTNFTLYKEKPRCRMMVKQRFGHKLVDKMAHYEHLAQKNGIKKCRNSKELKSNRRLVKITPTRSYTIAPLTHSHSYLTKEGKSLLDQIGRGFRKKLEGTPLAGSKFLVTSLTRTTYNNDRLQRRNGNAKKNSAHLYGESFDVSYRKFYNSRTMLSSCDRYYLRETLAQVIYGLRKNKKCWATKEKLQPCYHVVKR